MTMSRKVLRSALVCTAAGLLWISAGLSGQSTGQPSTKNGERHA
jgi:hypothetical protein